MVQEKNMLLKYMTEVIFQFLNDLPVTPWKMNGWNLQPSAMKRKENDLNQTYIIMFQPLIFRV